MVQIANGAFSDDKAGVTSNMWDKPAVYAEMDDTPPAAPTGLTATAVDAND